MCACNRTIAQDRAPTELFAAVSITKTPKNIYRGGPADEARWEGRRHATCSHAELTGAVRDSPRRPSLRSPDAKGTTDGKHGTVPTNDRTSGAHVETLPHEYRTRRWFRHWRCLHPCEGEVTPELPHNDSFTRRYCLCSLPLCAIRPSPHSLSSTYPRVSVAIWRKHFVHRIPPPRNHIGFIIVDTRCMVRKSVHSQTYLH